MKFPLTKEAPVEVKPLYTKGDKVYINKDEESNEVIEATIVQQSQVKHWSRDAYWVISKKNNKKYYVSEDRIHGKVEK